MHHVEPQILGDVHFINWQPRLERFVNCVSNKKVNLFWGFVKDLQRAQWLIQRPFSPESIQNFQLSKLDSHC